MPAVVEHNTTNVGEAVSEMSTDLLAPQSDPNFLTMPPEIILRICAFQSYDVSGSLRKYLLQYHIWIFQT